MGETTTAALIGGAASVGTGLIGALTNSAHRQYKYQKKLMALQNNYNVQNASTAYERSRQLTQDQALLEKQGKLNAGINTAFGQDGNIANASSAPQADGSSIPTPPDVNTPFSNLQTGVNNAVNQLISAATARANVAKLNAETEGVEIDNLTRNIKNLKEIGLKDSQIRKNFADLAYQKVVNKYADSRLSAESESANSKAIIDAADASVRGAMNKIEFDNKVQDLSNKVQTGILTQRQAVTEMRRWSLMESERLKNLAAVGELNTRSQLNVENTKGQALKNQFDAKTFDYRLVDAFENAEQNKLKTIGLKLRNLPHSISEHFTRSALFALERIQKGHGSGADYALVSAQIAREAIDRQNKEAKDWSKIILGALPLSSSGAASTSNSGYNVNVPYVPQY